MPFTFYLLPSPSTFSLLPSPCCDSLIMPPRGLVRNVPLSLRPLRRSWIGADSDEHERVEAGGGVGAGGGGDVDVEVSRGANGSELPPGEAAVYTISGGRDERAETSKRGSRLESDEAAPTSHARADAGPCQVRRRGRRAVRADVGRGASGERRRDHR